MKAPEHKLKVALCQMTSTDEVEHNLEQIETLLKQIPAGVDLAVFPENSLYFRLSKSRAVPQLNLSDSIFQGLQRQADERSLALLLGSAPMNEGKNRPSNATVFLQPHKAPEVVYRKVHLFDVDVVGQPPVRESDTFIHGSEPRLLSFKTWNLGLSICYDLRFAELFVQYARQGAHLILVPSAFLVPTGVAHWHVLLRARAIESQVFVLAPAQAGQHQNQGETRSTYGHSLAIDPWGEVIADLAPPLPQVQVVELDPARLERVWRQIPQAQHRRLR